MILDLDFGNSRIKWRLAADHSQGHASQGVVEDLKGLFAALQNRQPDRVRVASVRRGDALAEFLSAMRKAWGLDAELARVQRSCQGVSVGYEDLARLGVDRWLAMLAAYRRTESAVVVVDCGTALTVDLVDDQGRHRGGYIVPGLSLASRALTQNTAIRLEAEPTWALSPGNSSEEAVYHGVLTMLVGLLETVLARRIPELAIGDAPSLILTGGDAPLIRQNLSNAPDQVILEPDLVLDGLGVALP